jgi:RNA polymerase sigma factor (sigma-70 family)
VSSRTARRSERPVVAEPRQEAALERHEERELVLAAKRGDARARERLLESFLPRIVSLAREYEVAGLDFADRVQEGCVGFLRALERYDPALETPFWAYASWWVRQALQELQSDFLRPLRLPPKALGQLSQLKSSHRAFHVREGREPTVPELSQESGIALEQVQALLRADRLPRRLSDSIEGVEAEIGMVGELLHDPVSSDAYEAVLDSLAGTQVRSLLARLTQREQDVLASRFGLDGHRRERLAEIGARLGISAERVRQIEELALAKLRHAAAP